MQGGSIWGHGVYQASDWAADWLHWKLMSCLEIAFQGHYGKSYAALDEQEKLNIEYD